MRRTLVLLLAMWSAHAAAAPGVKDPVPLPPKQSPARHHLLHHDYLFGGAVALYLLSETTLRPYVAPTVCRWCATDSIDASVRDALVWRNPDRADTLSLFTGIVAPSIVPTAMVFFDGWHEESFADGIDDGLAIGEAAIAAGLVTQTVKFSAGRQRPYAHYRPSRLSSRPAPPSANDNDSFFSGHTSYSFAIAVASGEVASDRHYALAPEVWGVGLTLAATTGYLRIAADRHYLSDVVVGAAVGSALGWYVPKWLHDHGRIGTRIVPAPSGIAIVGTF